MQRLPYVDWARGFAVVAMVLWHTGDAWLRPGLHAGEGFFFLRFVGGLAAPSFLSLAGMAAALGARPARDRAEAHAQMLRGATRGAEILLLGYGLRLQTWLVDAAAIIQLHTLRAWLPLALGYAALFGCCRTLSKRPKRALLLLCAGVGLVIIGGLQVESVAPGRSARLLQVDVLQAIGASLLILALAEGLCRFLQRPWLLLGVGVAIAALTQPLGTLLPGSLPIPIAAYLGRFANEPGVPIPAALFPLFPWLAYACLGAALGSWLRAKPEVAESRLIWGVLLGALVAACTSEAHAFVQRALANEALVPPVRVVFRVGVVCVLLGFGFAFSSGKAARIVVDFGRASLRVYWFHLPFAYGILARPVRAKLGYAGWAILASALLVAMWGLTRIGSPSQRPQPDHA